jgi:hypothetical protein
MFNEYCLGNNSITIIDFAPEFSEHIRVLNYEWLEKYFRIEKGDVISLAPKLWFCGS